MKGGKQLAAYFLGYKIILLFTRCTISDFNRNKIIILNLSIIG